MIIYYHPIDGDAYTRRIIYRPRTCFVMTKLGAPFPNEIKNIRRSLDKYLSKREIEIIDAKTEITGRDFLVKIWHMIISVPFGIAIISGDLPPSTMSNIFYEVGLLQALGKETLIIKTKDSYIPTDFIRTEYIEYDKKFGIKINKFLDKFFEQADYYKTIANQLEQNPLLSIDYLKRAYLISGDSKFKIEAKKVFQNTTFDKYTTEVIKRFINC